MTMVSFISDFFVVDKDEAFFICSWLSVILLNFSAESSTSCTGLIFYNHLC
uniref:Uncharacterized protein n=1 Tax=Arundo donax TaxID=35708 RepID=A0A0A9CUB2_ARUDO